MPEDYLAELLDLMERYSFKRGDFTLSSGKRSNFYYDGKPVMLSPRGQILIGRIVFERVTRAGAEAVGGLTSGADFISSAVVYTSEVRGKPVPGFYVRDVPKEHGTREILYQSYSDNGHEVVSSGRRVAIVDDVMTTGKSIQKAISEVERRGAEVALVLTLVDRCDPEGDCIRNRYNFETLFSVDSEGRVRVDSTSSPHAAAV